MKSDKYYLCNISIEKGKIMADKKLTKKQQELVERLMKTGIPRQVAVTLVFVAGKDETRSIDIQKATGLKQPEVSIAMQNLEERRWVTKRNIKQEKKGRPFYGYRLNKDINEIVAEIEKKEHQKIKDIEDNLTKIKKLI